MTSSSPRRKSFVKQLFAYVPVILLLVLIGLAGCEPSRGKGFVPKSFGYALGGTFAIMGVALVIATVVTSRSKRRKRDEE